MSLTLLLAVNQQCVLQHRLVQYSPGIRTGKRVPLSEQLFVSESRRLIHLCEAAQVRAGGLHVGNGTRARTCAGAGLLPQVSLFSLGYIICCSASPTLV